MRRFRKELIKVGDYVKPADGISFKVTPDLLQHWSMQFRRMAEGGVRVPCPAGHTDDVDANRGWVVDMFPDGDALIGIVDLVGEDAIKLAGRADVSIYSPVEFVDGKGNRYERPILHCALCTDPVIPGLAGFVPIVASRGGQPVQVPVLKLQEGSQMEVTPVAVPAAPATPTTDPNAKPKDALKDSFKQAINSVLDDEKLDPKDALKKIKDILKAREKALGLLDDTGAADGKPSDAEGAQVVAASHKPTVDPMLLKLAHKSRKQDLDALVTAGKIVPAVRDKLAKRWLDGDALQLSLTAAGVDQFDALIEALNDNAPVVQLGEQTGAQALTLTHPSKRDEPDEKTKGLIAHMRAAAGLK